MTTRSVFRLTAAAALVVSLVAVPAVSGAADVPAKPTGEPVQLMVIGIFSGGGIDFSDVPKAAKAAAAALNKKDGINGSPVKIIECDTGIDPNKAEDCARRAVEEKMTAVVGAFTEYDYIDIIAEAGIPSVANYGIGFTEYTNPMAFPIGATAIGGTGGMGSLLADVGAKTVNTAYLDIAGGAGKLAAEFVDLGLTPRGVPKASLTAIPTGGADLQPTVQQTIDADTEGVAVVAVDPEFSKWLVAYRQTGGKADLVSTGSTLNPSNIKALGDAVEDVYVATNFKPASLTKDPSVKKMIKEIKAFDKSIRLFDGSIEAWAGVHLVADALEGQPANDAATLVAQLNTDTTWDTGVGPPVNFTKQPPEIAETGGLIASIPRVFTTSVYYAQVKNGKLKAVDNKAHNFLVG